MQTTHQVVLITGGATGIGLALAKKFTQAGNKVIIASRSQAALDAARLALPSVLTHRADITSADDRAALVAAYPDVTVLINNAGQQIIKQIEDVTDADSKAVMDVNFHAPLALTRAFLPILKAKASSAVVNVGSALVIVPKQSAAMYCASKAALHSITQTLRWQLEGTPVKVFEVLPSLVDTPMTAGRATQIKKISPEVLVEEFWRGFAADRYEMLIGKVKLLSLINRIAPTLAQRIIRGG